MQRTAPICAVRTNRGGPVQTAFSYRSKPLRRGDENGNILMFLSRDPHIRF